MNGLFEFYVIECLYNTNDGDITLFAKFSVLLRDLRKGGEFEGNHYFLIVEGKTFSD